VNPDYIERVRTRHAHRFDGLELVCADVQSESLAYGPVDRDNAPFSWLDSFGLFWK